MFVDLVKFENEVSTRNQQEYTLSEAVLLIEGAINKRYTFPWHKHDALDVSKSSISTNKGTSSIFTNTELLDLYDDVEDYIACHNHDSTLSNKEPSVVDLYIDDSDPSALANGVISVLGSLATAPGASPQRFNTSESYNAVIGDCNNNFLSFELPVQYTNNINHNLKPNIPIATNDPNAYNVINVTYHELAIGDPQFGWAAPNTSDITPGDNFKDYNTWWFRCSNNLNSPLPFCEDYILDGENTPLYEAVLCLENTTGDMYELNFYQDNMQQIISSVPPYFNKTFVNCNVTFRTQLATLGRTLRHISEVRMGDKELINNPKELLTCG